MGKIFFLSLFAIFTLFKNNSSFADSGYRFERMWPTLQQPWNFFNPEEISISKSGDVFVADTFNNRIVKMNRQGKVNTSTTKTGGTITDLDRPITSRTLH